MNKRIGDLGVIVLDIGDANISCLPLDDGEAPRPVPHDRVIMVGAGGRDGVASVRGLSAGESGVIIAESGPKTVLDGIKRIQDIKIVDVHEIYKEANARARHAMDDWCCELAYYTDGHSHQDCKEHP